MLTVEQAAEKLGVRPATVRAWVLYRKIQFVKLGRSVRIDPAVVERIIQEGTVPAKRGLAQ